jgi:nucleotide-binding universal stress UspA family protein
MWANPPRSILVAVDFGDASARALRVARVLAERFGSSITALHAETIDVPPYFTHDQLHAVEHQRDQTRREAAAYLASFVSPHAPDASPLLIDGPAVPAILAAAERHDLLVTGTHGRRGPERWWMGSVAERVVRETSIPTLVVRAQSGSDDERAIFARPVAVAGPEFSGEARGYAASLATAFGGVMGEHAVASLGDLTCTPDATLMAISVGGAPGGGWFGDAAERLVRQCRLPMLFLPNRAS